MDLNEYQVSAIETAIYPGAGRGTPESINYAILGLIGEAGETANKFKKVLRGDYRIDTVLDQIEDELGDVLWYAAMLCSEIGRPLEEVALNNLEKLQTRQSLGTLRGQRYGKGGKGEA